jgi:hypothetical protein
LPDALCLTLCGGNPTLVLSFGLGFDDPLFLPFQHQIALELRDGS